MSPAVDREIYSKIYRAIESVLNETVIKIEKIESRNYGYDFFEDLGLKEYNRFFEEIISYLKRYAPVLPGTMTIYLDKMYRLKEHLPFKEKKTSFLSLLGPIWAFFTYSMAYKNNVLEILKLIKQEAGNFLDWLKIEL